MYYGATGINEQANYALQGTRPSVLPHGHQLQSKRPAGRVAELVR
jgi:hypothetical protein